MQAVVLGSNPSEDSECSEWSRWSCRDSRVCAVHCSPVSQRHTVSSQVSTLHASSRDSAVWQQWSAAV